MSICRARVLAVVAAFVAIGVVVTIAVAWAVDKFPSTPASSGFFGEIVYAPRDHGVRGLYDLPSSTTSVSTISGVSYEQMRDRYYLDPTGLLHIVVPSAEGYEGLWSV